MGTLAILFAGFIGFITYKLVSYNVNGKTKVYSPDKFDLGYWISDRDNWNDALLGFILFLIITTFKDEFFIGFPTNFIVVFLEPFKDKMFLYVIVGFTMSYIIKILRVALSRINKKSKL